MRFVQTEVYGTVNSGFTTLFSESEEVLCVR
jgi:hypothetical protein